MLLTLGKLNRGKRSKKRPKILLPRSGNVNKITQSHTFIFS
jgi:hypothetical protein